MSLTASKGRLEGLTKELCAQWAVTKESWLDAKSREFEQRFMDELLTNVNHAAAAIQELEKVVTKVRNDCE
jgi:flagellar biosynthesis chaperone FliJ